MDLKPLSRCGKCNQCTPLRPCVECGELFAPRTHDPAFMRKCPPCMCATSKLSLVTVDGLRLPGGCDRCATPFQTFHAEDMGEYLLIVTHNDWCPVLHGEVTP